MRAFILALKAFGYVWIATVVLTSILGVIGIWALGGPSATLELSSKAMREGTQPTTPEVPDLTRLPPSLLWVLIIVSLLLSAAPGVVAVALAGKLRDIKRGARPEPRKDDTPEVSGRTEQLAVGTASQTNTLEQAIGDLLASYRNVERRSLALDPISVSPLLISMWNLIKCYFYLLFDLLLTPVHTVIVIRNLFPGRWSLRLFSWPYLKYGALWIWRGESPQAPAIVVRWLVVVLLHTHFQRRFRLLRRRLLLDDALSLEHRTGLISQIDQRLQSWETPRIPSVLFTYGLPIAGFLLQFYKTFQPDQLPGWTAIVTVTLFSYVFGFLITAFMVKRGLMLGGDGRAAFFPGALDSTGIYRMERQLFERIGVPSTELPLDIVIFGIVGIIPLVFVERWVDLYRSWGLSMPSHIWIVAESGGLIVVSAVFACYRRLRLGRG